MVAATTSGMSTFKNIPSYIRHYCMPTALNPATWFHNNFATVQEGALYRSKTLSPKDLKKVIDEKQIKTILNLREGYGIWFDAEKAVAGDIITTVTLNGNKLPTKEQVKAIYNVLSDPKNEPILVHCVAGADRTGFACAFYKLIKGYSLEEALNQQTSKFCHFEWRYPLMRKCTQALHDIKRKLDAQSTLYGWGVAVNEYNDQEVLAEIKKNLPSMPMRMIYALGSTIKENKKVAIAIGGLATLAAAALYAHKNGKLMPAVSAVKNKIFGPKAPSSAPDEIDDPPSFA